MDKYIFLDIDGVLATPECVIHGMWGLVESKQKMLGSIIERTGAKIVLSSSWRKSNLYETKAYLLEHGFMFTDLVVGQTIIAYHYIERGVHLSIPRGVEIKQWLDTNVHSNNGKDWRQKEYGKDFSYVILDDDSDMLLEQAYMFVHCDSMEGLTDVLVEMAIRKLNCDYNKL